MYIVVRVRVREQRIDASTATAGQCGVSTVLGNGECYTTYLARAREPKLESKSSRAREPELGRSYLSTSSWYKQKCMQYALLVSSREKLLSAREVEFQFKGNFSRDPWNWKLDIVTSSGLLPARTKVNPRPGLAQNVPVRPAGNNTYSMYIELVVYC